MGAGSNGRGVSSASGAVGTDRSDGADFDDDVSAQVLRAFADGATPCLTEAMLRELKVLPVPDWARKTAEGSGAESV